MKHVPFAVANIGGLHGSFVEIFKDEYDLLYGSFEHDNKSFEIVVNPFKDGNIHTNMIANNGLIEVDF